MEWVNSVSHFRNRPFQCVHFDARPSPGALASGTVERFDVQDFRDDVLTLIDTTERAHKRRTNGGKTKGAEDEEDDDGELGEILCRVWQSEDLVRDLGDEESLEEDPRCSEEEEDSVVSPRLPPEMSEAVAESKKLKAKEKIAIRVELARAKKQQQEAGSKSLEREGCLKGPVEPTTSSSSQPSQLNFNEIRRVVKDVPDHFEAIESEIGAVLWRDAADFFLKFLEKYRSSWSGTRVIELGAGCGYVGLGLAADGAEATITDLEEFVAHMRVNKYVNIQKEREQSWNERVHVEKCDWMEATMPAGDFDYVICCEVLYAGRDCWPGLKACLVQASHRANFKEILLVINLRVGQKDIGDFVEMVSDELTAEKIYDNYSDSRDEVLEAWRAKMGHPADNGGGKKKGIKARKAVKSKRAKPTDESSEKSITDFNIEVYSFRARTPMCASGDAVLQASRGESD